MGYKIFEQECRVKGVLEELIPEEIRLIPDDLALKVKTVAALFNSSEETVRRWCRTGEMNYLRGGKIFKITGLDIKEFWFKKNLKVFKR